MAIFEGWKIHQGLDRIFITLGRHNVMNTQKQSSEELECASHSLTSNATLRIIIRFLRSPMAENYWSYLELNSPSPVQTSFCRELYGSEHIFLLIHRWTSRYLLPYSYHKGVLYISKDDIVFQICYENTHSPYLCKENSSRDQENT